MSSLAAKLRGGPKTTTRTRQVRLRLVYLDFWSVVKLSFLVSLASAVVIIVVTALVWIVLDQTGVFDKVDAQMREILNVRNFSIMDQFALGRVLGFSIIVGFLNVFVGTVLGAVVSVLHNLSARITGGLLVGFTNE